MSKNAITKDRNAIPVTGVIPVSAVLCAVMSLVLICTAPVQAGQKQTGDLLTFIRHLEAAGGYDVYEHRITVAPPKKLTAMSVADVLAWQKRVRAEGNPSSAAGGYQIIWSTLRRLVRKYAIDTAKPFDRAMQDRLAQLLISECGPQRATARFANCLAGIWAALPLASGPHKGRSAHHGTAANRALTKPQTVLALLAGKPVALRRATQGNDRRPDATRFRVVGAAPKKTTPPVPSAPSAARIAEAMRAAEGSGRLTPSVRTWKLDPYAQH